MIRLFTCVAWPAVYYTTFGKLQTRPQAAPARHRPEDTAGHAPVWRAGRFHSCRRTPARVPKAKVSTVSFGLLGLVAVSAWLGLNKVDEGFNGWTSTALGLIAASFRITAVEGGLAAPGSSLTPSPEQV
jgi:hypothetical protein